VRAIQTNERNKWTEQMNDQTTNQKTTSSRSASFCGNKICKLLLCQLGARMIWWMKNSSLPTIPSAWWGHGSICTSTAYKGCQSPYIYNMDVRWIWVGSTASITSFHHHISAVTFPDLWQNSTSSVNMSGHNVVWTHPYAHQKHIMVVKHLLYI
jgi:hypothetical protein